MIDLSGSSACRRHRAALLDFVDRGEIADGTGAALGHLDRCDRCTAELESTVLTITAIRRLGDEAARVEPAPDAWPRLRARLAGWRPFRWSVMSPSAGVVMSAAIVAVLVAPLQIGGSDLAGRSASPAVIDERTTISATERRIEADYIASTRRSRAVEAAVIVAEGVNGAQSILSIPRIYPDNIRRERKEVAPTEPSGRSPDAI
jgi:hypothetical protein